MGSRSYVDVNIFIYWLGSHPKFGKVAYEWIKKIENAHKGKYLTSSLTIYQTLVIIAGLTGSSLKDKNLIKNIIDPLRSLKGLEIIPLTIEDYTTAPSLMQEYDLDYEDALHLSAALKSKVKEIISNDQDFDRTSLKRIFI